MDRAPRALAVGRLVSQLCDQPIPPKAATQELVEEVDELGSIESPPVLEGFENDQNLAQRVIVYNRIFYTLWPSMAGSRVHQHAGSELNVRMAERIEWPSERRFEGASMLHIFSFGLWGRSAGEERDERTSTRGEYETRRALQSARGHVTRELIGELQEEIDRRWPEVEEILSGLEAALADPIKISEWNRESNEIEKDVRLAWHMKKAEGMTKSERESTVSAILRKSRGQHRK
ncbi:hypothetical protein [Streptomyces sp. NPDC056661]|uniref:hypothetical protein n=1 Tax=Streptomyces sp. NPDC056661 TaxID=3345898 RepID=UPI0036C05C07